MKRAFLAVAILLFSAGLANAQTTAHKTTLTWPASSTAGAQYNVWRGASCAGPFTKLTATPVSALTYVDSGMADGTVFAYYVTAIAPLSGESTQSNCILATTPSVTPAPPITAPPGNVTSAST